MTARAGSNFDFELFPVTIDKNLFAMQQIFAAYQAGPDSEFQNWWDFRREVKSGHIVCGQVLRGGELVGLFGFELMTRPNAWLNWLFYTGRMDRELAADFMLFVYSVLQNWKMESGLADRPGAVRVMGRPAWRRFLRSLGLAIDDKGFVYDDQEDVRHGLIKRLQ